MKISVYGEELNCYKATKGIDFIYLYDENDNKIISFEGISSFDGYSIIEGNWSSPELTDKERIAALEEIILKMGGTI